MSTHMDVHLSCRCLGLSFGGFVPSGVSRRSLMPSVLSVRLWGLKNHQHRGVSSAGHLVPYPTLTPPPSLPQPIRPRRTDTDQPVELWPTTPTELDSPVRRHQSRTHFFEPLTPSHHRQNRPRPAHVLPDPRTERRGPRGSQYGKGE